MTAATKATVLLVEDNEELNAVNQGALVMEGYRVLIAETLQEAEALLAGESIDVIVLDILLPDGSGLALCKKLREAYDTPILFLSALGEPTQRVEGLRAGGDDYLGKPYLIEELCARVQALLRRAHLENRQAMDPTEQIYGYGPLRLDFIRNKVYLSGQEVFLAPREFLLLRYLVLHRGEVLSPDFLYRQLWGEAAEDASGTLRTHVKKLRKKLRLSENPYISLDNEYGKGYRLSIRD